MKYRIKLIEAVGDYFQDEWTEDYDTLEQAKRRIIIVNADRTLKHDIMALEKIEEVLE